MPTLSWGTLAPEKIEPTRRVRSLGVGAAVRSFNDRAVPGLGGIWYGKQILNPLLGIHAAQLARAAGRRDIRNIPVANAVEALGCYIALERNGWTADARVRGKNKMQGQQDLRFKNVVKPTFYVTQPFRPAAIQPLLALDLVEGSSERFNDFSLSDELGKRFVDTAYGGARTRKPVSDILLAWIMGELDEPTKNAALKEALSPCEVMPNDARSFLRNQLKQAHDEYERRRGDAWDWVSSVSTADDISWDKKPPQIADDHWTDLEVGALFFRARTAAIDLLEDIEQLIEKRERKSLDLHESLPDELAERVSVLRQRSQAFLAREHDPSDGNVATKFCLENAQPSTEEVLRSLCERDGRVLKLNEQRIVPGPAFRGTRLVRDVTANADEDVSNVAFRSEIRWPDGISNRIRNLWLLQLDLQGQLNSWLGNIAREEDQNDEEN